MRNLPVLVAVLACLGCESLIGADFDDAKRRPTADAGVDAQAEGGACINAVPPVPPEVTGAGGDTRFTVVLHDFYFGEGKDPQDKPDYYNVGFDLDGVCANHGQAPNCTADFPTADPTDGPRGEDNGVGRMLSEQEPVFGATVITGTNVSNGVAEGRYAPIGVIEVGGYNGFSEDDVLEVTWSVALATEANPSGKFVPKLDGSDMWPLADAAEAGGTAGTALKFTSTRAYANKRRLVAFFDDALVPLANVYFEAKQIVLTADLNFDPADQTWSLGDGLLGGYSEADELLAVVPRITTQFLGVPLCTDNKSYPMTKEFICANADYASPALPPGQPCDAVSFAMRFESVVASAGELGAFPPAKAKCPAATDPASDSCSIPVKR